ncbi:glutathione S-transferase [Ancylothrix sp. C2]|uniref:glutathione S-transferase n=1 Tax=Ancylothrix sp. D3o TaxID=2953691 RepID=UPI0021BBA603|nr:glutathione S-transferase [Ancylothrix sp. D3o]MCT7949606.1 glutathione S-transferase [Ancylothrix sp. D3o]
MKKFAVICLLLWFVGVVSPALALPPPEDIPEEILRTEIFTEARSPLDGSLVSAAEYISIQEDLQKGPAEVRISSDIQHLIFLLKVRGFLRNIIPFVP